MVPHYSSVFPPVLINHPPPAPQKKIGSTQHQSRNNLELQYVVINRVVIVHALKIEWLTIATDSWFRCLIKNSTFVFVLYLSVI